MENEMMKVKYCQCCAMPMASDEAFGANADGSRNEEYCCYCMKNGKATDATLPQMVDACAQIMTQQGSFTDIAEAKTFMGKVLPTLKHWRKAEMKPEIVEFPETRMAGISAVTSNTDPEIGTIIGSLWGNFYSKGIYASMMGNKPALSYGIYSDYENEANGKYKLTVAVPFDGELPEGVEKITVPAGKYKRYFVAADDMSAIGKAWAEIGAENLKRTFVADFEEYLTETTLYIYIGIED